MTGDVANLETQSGTAKFLGYALAIPDYAGFQVQTHDVDITLMDIPE